MEKMGSISKSKEGKPARGFAFFGGRSASVYLNFAQGVQMFSEGGDTLEIERGINLSFGPLTQT